MTFSLLVASAVASAVLASALSLRGKGDASRGIRDLCFAVAVVACYEVVWVKYGSAIFADPAGGAELAANHPFAMLAFDILPPTLLSATTWTVLRWRSARVFTLLLICSVGWAIVSLAIFRPMYLRGTAEALGWLSPHSSYHLSGVYDFSLMRAFVYTLLVPLLGVPFAMLRGARNNA